MALATFAPSPAPSPGTGFKPVIKVLDADFGEGYSQPTPDGINNIRQNLALAWHGLTLTQRNTIVGFFEATKGATPFYYQPIGAATVLKWTCSTWEQTAAGGIWTIAATLKQSFTALT